MQRDEYNEHREHNAFLSLPIGAFGIAEVAGPACGLSEAICCGGISPSPFNFFLNPFRTPEIFGKISKSMKKPSKSYLE